MILPLYSISACFGSGDDVLGEVAQMNLGFKILN